MISATIRLFHELKYGTEFSHIRIAAEECIAQPLA
jgi:hypothetical protein